MSAIMMMVVGTTSQSTIVAPTNIIEPVVTGSTVDVGSVLTTSLGSWIGTGAITYTYQWRRFGSPYNIRPLGYYNIPGATSSTYSLKTTDVGMTLRCVVTGTSTYGTGSALSTETAAITATSVAISYLVIGGGGGSTQSTQGGGGGGGGFVEGTANLAFGTSYTATIGAGRTSGQSIAVGNFATSGVSSSFLSSTALGGGGAGALGGTGQNGGCGGGGGAPSSLNDNQNAGGTGSQGGDGGSGYLYYFQGGGRGGGGGGAGGNGAGGNYGGVGADGGASREWPTGSQTYYAPGGNTMGTPNTVGNRGSMSAGTYGRGAGATASGFAGCVVIRFQSGYPQPTSLPAGYTSTIGGGDEESIVNYYTITASGSLVF